MNKTKVLLFKVTKKDLVLQTFRAGGKGGQNQNKRNTGVRIIHPESGAVGESRAERSQYQNRKLALEHLANSPEFKKWVRVKAAEVQGKLDDLNERVDELMLPHNLRIETKDANGRWVELKQ